MFYPIFSRVQVIDQLTNPINNIYTSVLLIQASVQLGRKSALILSVDRWDSNDDRNGALLGYSSVSQQHLSPLTWTKWLAILI